MNGAPGVKEITPIRIYEEPELLSAKKATSGYKPIKLVKVVSDSFFDLFGNGTYKAKRDAFSKLEEYIAETGGNVAVIKSRHLSGGADVQLELIAEVYNIPSL